MCEPKIDTSNVETDPANHPSTRAWRKFASERGVSAGTEALWQDELHCEVQLAWGGRGSESVIAGCWLDAKTSPIRHLSAELIVLAGLV